MRGVLGRAHENDVFERDFRRLHPPWGKYCKTVKCKWDMKSWIHIFRTRPTDNCTCQFSQCLLCGWCRKHGAIDCWAKRIVHESSSSVEFLRLEFLAFALQSTLQTVQCSSVLDYWIGPTDRSPDWLIDWVTFDNFRPVSVNRIKLELRLANDWAWGLKETWEGDSRTPSWQEIFFS